MYGVPWLSIPLSAGAMVSFFALALSCMNAGARVMFAMGRHGIFHPGIRTAHSVNKTPHVALAVMAIMMFTVVVFFKLSRALKCWMNSMTRGRWAPSDSWARMS